MSKIITHKDGSWEQHLDDGRVQRFTKDDEKPLSEAEVAKVVAKADAEVAQDDPIDAKIASAVEAALAKAKK